MALQCAIAAPHELAVEAGEEAVRNGGNAIDAALAAAVTLTVVYPHMCSIGGDLFALVADPGGEVKAIDASGAASGLTDGGELVRRHGVMPITGPDTVTVPGVLEGWDTVASLGAAGTVANSIRTAARLARDGVPVAPSLAKAILTFRSLLAADPGMSEVFHPGGEPLAEGDALVQSALANTLESIGESGADAFYRGSVGEDFLRGMEALGSGLRAGDLDDHRSRLSDPITKSFGDYDVMTSPPGSQGFVLLEILGAIERVGDLQLLFNDADLLAQVFRLASRDRDRYLADPHRVKVPVDRLLSPDHFESILTQAQLELKESNPTPPSRPRPTGDTVAVVAVDSEGRAVSLIQSVFHAFGAGLLEPRTGIICQNRGACFSLDPESPNRIAPGKRPAHTLMPVLLRDPVGRISALGTMGGRAQPQIHAQLLLQHLCGNSPEGVVSSPRFVVGGLDAGSESDIIFAEAGLSPETAAALRRTGLEVKMGAILDEIVGHTQLAMSTKSGLSAASDPRADGTGRVISPFGGET